LGSQKNKSQPICQDTGSIIFYVDCPVGFDQLAFQNAAQEAVKIATKKGLSTTEFGRFNHQAKNDGTNLGPGSPTIPLSSNIALLPEISVRLVAQRRRLRKRRARNTSLPNEKAQSESRPSTVAAKSFSMPSCKLRGKGCGSPAFSGYASEATARTGYEFSKQQFLLRKLDDQNENTELNRLEQDIVDTANKLGIGPDGLWRKKLHSSEQRLAC